MLGDVLGEALGLKLVAIGAGVAVIGAGVEVIGAGVALIGTGVEVIGAGVALIGTGVEVIGAGVALIGVGDGPSPKEVEFPALNFPSPSTILWPRQSRLYHPLPWLQQIPSPQLSIIVKVYSTSNGKHS
jgi:hypothetical protein